MLVDKGKMHAKVKLALKKISNYCFIYKKIYNLTFIFVSFF